MDLSIQSTELLWSKLMYKRDRWIILYAVYFGHLELGITQQGGELC